MSVALPVLRRLRALHHDAEDFSAPMAVSAVDLQAFADCVEMQDRLLRAARLALLAVGRTPTLDQARLKLLGVLDDVLGPLP